MEAGEHRLHPRLLPTRLRSSEVGATSCSSRSAASSGFCCGRRVLLPEGDRRVPGVHLLESPGDLGFDGEPTWWPLPWLALSGLLVALTISYLPGTAGHKPAEGFTSGEVRPIGSRGSSSRPSPLSASGSCSGRIIAIALGGGIGILAVQLVKRDRQTASMVIGAAGSFAAVSTLLGSPIVGAFLMMEVVGLGGAMMGVVLMPGLLAAGLGALIFVGLDSSTGYGTFSLSVPDIPAFGPPTGAEFLWAIAIGLAGAVLGAAIRRFALLLQKLVEQRMVLLMPVVGLLIGGLAIVFAEASDKSCPRCSSPARTRFPD